MKNTPQPNPLPLPSMFKSQRSYVKACVAYVEYEQWRIWHGFAACISEAVADILHPPPAPPMAQWSRATVGRRPDPTRFYQMMRVYELKVRQGKSWEQVCKAMNREFPKSKPLKKSAYAQMLRDVYKIEKALATGQNLEKVSKRYSLPLDLMKQVADPTEIHAPITPAIQ